MGIEEAKIDGANIKFNGWFRWVVGGVAGCFFTGFIILASNVIANDKKYMDKINNNAVKIGQMDIKLDYIIENQQEFKEILKRTAPYQRKNFNE